MKTKICEICGSEIFANDPCGLCRLKLDDMRRIVGSQKLEIAERDQRIADMEDHIGDIEKHLDRTKDDYVRKVKQFCISNDMLDKARGRIAELEKELEMVRETNITHVQMVIEKIRERDEVRRDAIELAEMLKGQMFANYEDHEETFAYREADRIIEKCRGIK